MKQRIRSQWQLGFLRVVAIVVLSAVVFPVLARARRRRKQRRVS